MPIIKTLPFSLLYTEIPEWKLHESPLQHPPSPYYRTWRWTVQFDAPFPASENPPVVIVSVLTVMADMKFHTDFMRLRYAINVTGRTLSGFTADVQCWDETQLYGVSGTWTAFEQ